MAGSPGAPPAHDFNTNEAGEKAPVSHNTEVAMGNAWASGKGVKSAAQHKNTSAALQEREARGKSRAAELCCV